MTEAEWWSCEDVFALERELGLLGAMTFRKTRLLLHTRLRSITHLLSEEQALAVSASEESLDRDGPALRGPEEFAAWGEALRMLRRVERMTGVRSPARCGLVRDAYGNPFRPVTLPLSCLTPTTVALARAAYDERILPQGHLDPERLAVLADALEEREVVGEVVEHLRREVPHVRGCWAVDLVLGKG